MQADDILILASDGLSDNLWDEDVLDEIVRMRRSWSSLGSGSKNGSTASDGDGSVSSRVLGRGTLAGMLSEALCSRARCVSERRPQAYSRRSSHRRHQQLAAEKKQDDAQSQAVNEADDIPFGRRAREEGRWFAGGKLDGQSSVHFLGHEDDANATLLTRYIRPCCRGLASRVKYLALSGLSTLVPSFPTYSILF